MRFLPGEIAVHNHGFPPGLEFGKRPAEGADFPTTGYEQDAPGKIARDFREGGNQGIQPLVGLDRSDEAGDALLWGDPQGGLGLGFAQRRTSHGGEWNSRAAMRNDRGFGAGPRGAVPTVSPPHGI